MPYIPWWQRLSPPTFAERFNLGGLAGRVGFKDGIPKQDLIKSEAAIKIDQANPNLNRNQLRKIYKDSGLTIEGKTLKRKRPFRMTDELIEKIKVILADPKKYPDKESMQKALGYRTDPRPGRTYGQGSFDVLLKEYEQATGRTIDKIKRFPKTFRYKGSQIAADIISEVKSGLAQGDTLNVKQLAKKYLKDLYIRDEGGARAAIRNIISGEIEIAWDARENISGENTGAKNVRARRWEKIKAAAKLAGKDAIRQVNALKLDVETLNETYRKLAQTEPEKILNNKKLIDALSVTFDVQTGEIGRKPLSRNEILRIVNEGIFELEHIRPVHTVKFEPGKTVAKKLVAGHAVGWPTNLQIATRNMNGQFLNNIQNYMLHNKLDVLPKNAAEILKNQGLRTYVNGKYHGSASGVGWNSKTNSSDIFKKNLKALDLAPDQKLLGDKFLKKVGNVAKPILKYAGKTALKIAGTVIPPLSVAAYALGAHDVKRAHAMGMDRPEELATAYYLGPGVAKGWKDIREYDYKDRAEKEWEKIKESWKNRETGTEETVDVEDEIMFAKGGIASLKK